MKFLVLSHFCIKVLGVYRKLLRTTRELFSGDMEALIKSRVKIKESFLGNRMLTDPVKIAEQIKIADETIEFLQQGVVQGRLHATSGTYQIKLSKHTKLHDNIPLKESNSIDLSSYTIPDKFLGKNDSKIDK